MGRAGQALSPRHVACAVRAARRRPPDLLLIAAEDGQRIAGHRSLLCLFSPTFAALLAGHDQGEGIVKVFLEVSSIGLFAFHRILKTGGQTAETDWSLAEEALRLLDVTISPEPEEADGLHGPKAAKDSYEDFLRDSFIKHENDKGEAEEKKCMLGQEVSSKVAVARALSAHAPDLVLVAGDGAMVLGHRSLLALFSPVFRQLLPRHDQQEELLALSLPFARDAVFAFHRICESGGRTDLAAWGLAGEVLGLMQVSVEHSGEPELDSVDALLNTRMKVVQSSTARVKNIRLFEYSNETKAVDDDDDDDDDFIDDEEDEDYDDGYYEKRDRGKRRDGSGKEWKCKHCDATFSSRSTRYRHQVSHEEEAAAGGVKREDGEGLDEDGDWTDEPKRTNLSMTKTSKARKVPADNRRVYSCKKCKQTFKQKPAYLQHKLSHGAEQDEEDSAEEEDDDKGDEKPFVCDLCPSGQFKRKSSMVKHMIVDHDETVTCDHCPQQFDNPVTWAKHVKSHRTAQCDICAKMFTEVQLRVHKRLNHEQAKKQCPLCPAQVQMLRVHMENCHTGELRTCTACPFTSRRKADIDVHYRKMHTDLNKQTCHGCGEVFKKLKAHLLRTKCGTGFKAEANVPCPHCPKMFTHKMGVDKHINAIHLQIKNKHCQFCDYRTYNMFNLNLHIANRHKGEKMEKQQCRHCDKVVMSMDWHLKIYHPEMYHPGVQ